MRTTWLLMAGFLAVQLAGVVMVASLTAPAPRYERLSQFSLPVTGQREIWGERVRIVGAVSWEKQDIPFQAFATYEGLDGAVFETRSDPLLLNAYLVTARLSLYDSNGFRYTVTLRNWPPEPEGGQQ